MYVSYFLLKSGIVKKQQLANVKAHLYKQILISLRLNPSHQNIRIQIREQLDFATILYHKGLYKQGLKILDKGIVKGFDKRASKVFILISMRFSFLKMLHALLVLVDTRYCNAGAVERHMSLE